MYVISVAEITSGQHHPKNFHDSLNCEEGSGSMVIEENLLRSCGDTKLVPESAL